MSGSVPADRQLVYYERFTENLKAELRGYITEDLIDEFRRQPLGRHSDSLERVLNWIRRAPAFALYCRTPCREYQVIRLPVKPGSRPAPIDDIVYTNEDEALHAVFMKHLELLQADGGAA